MSSQELTFLAKTAWGCSSIIIEVGCYKGRSTKVLADNTKAIIYAVDPWSGIYYNNEGGRHGIKTDVFDTFEQNLKTEIRNGKVLVAKQKFSEFNIELLRFADFIFIDGDHRYEEVKHDIYKAKSLLKPGGILAGHDYGHSEWTGVQKAVNELIPAFQLVQSIWWCKLE